MKHSHLAFTSLIVCFFISIANAIPPSPAHKQLSTDLENAINWSKHLREEASKGSALSREHVDQEIKGIQDALKSMDLSTIALGNESPGDLKEGHFLSLKKHQKKATTLVESFITEYNKSPPNYSKMKSAAKNTLSALEAAHSEHQKELNEIELHPEP